MATDRVTIVSPDAAAIERLGQALRAAGFLLAPAISCLGDLPEPCAHSEGEWVLFERRTGDIPGLISVPDSGEDSPAERGGFAPATLEEIERSHLAATLHHTRGNKRQAALLLGIARSTLQQKVRRYGLDRGVPG